MKKQLHNLKCYTLADPVGRGRRGLVPLLFNGIFVIFIFKLTKSVNNVLAPPFLVKPGWHLFFTKCLLISTRFHWTIIVLIRYDLHFQIHEVTLSKCIFKGGCCTRQNLIPSSFFLLHVPTVVLFPRICHYFNFIVNFDD